MTPKTPTSEPKLHSAWKQNANCEAIWKEHANAQAGGNREAGTTTPKPIWDQHHMNSYEI